MKNLPAVCTCFLSELSQQIKITRQWPLQLSKGLVILQAIKKPTVNLQVFLTGTNGTHSTETRTKENKLIIYLHFQIIRQIKGKQKPTIPFALRNHSWMGI